MWKARCISEYGEIKAIGMQYFLKLSPATQQLVKRKEDSSDQQMLGEDE